MIAIHGPVKLSRNLCPEKTVAVKNSFPPLVRAIASRCQHVSHFQPLLLSLVTLYWSVKMPIYPFVVQSGFHSTMVGLNSCENSCERDIEPMEL